MGLGAETRTEQEIADALFWDNVHRRASDREWLTGKRLSEMDISHIKNCMKQLERESGSDLYEIYYPMFKRELKQRGEKE